MAKPYAWALLVPEILEHLRRIPKSHWSRRMIEREFRVRRTAATAIMRAVGYLGSDTLNLTVRAARLKRFLIAANKAMDTAVGKASRAAKLSAFMKQRLANATPAPKLRNVFTTKEPDSLTVAELPSAIRISKGEIRIRFKSANEAINLVGKLCRAIMFDLLWFQFLCEPPAEERLIVDENSPESRELRELMRKLVEKEREKGNLALSDNAESV